MGKTKEQLIEEMKHDWYPLCSDINVKWYDTYNWWKCSNCKKETERTKEKQDKPSDEGCKAKKSGSIFPLSSI